MGHGVLDSPMPSLHNQRIAIGRHIRLRRQHLEMSQSTLATAMGITRKALGNIEKGRTSLPFESAPIAAEMLELESPMVFFNEICEGWK